LFVSIWGRSNVDNQLEIDREGFVEIETQSGFSSQKIKVYLKDFTFGQAKELLKSRYARSATFQSDEFNVSLQSSRTMQIGIYGEVFNPGNHTISAFNNAINALVAAGGPTDIGGIREIQIIRPGREKITFDLYKYLQSPNSSDNLYLQDNDIIFVPTNGNIVNLIGSVKRPFKYEMLSSESLSDLIGIAGGLRANAYTEIAKVKRFENNVEKLLDVNLANVLAGNEVFLLEDGDEISINSIPETYKNIVTVDGEVLFPGEFEVFDNEKISDVLRRAKLGDKAKLDFAYIIRDNNDGSKKYEFFKINAIIQNPSDPTNFTLKPRDHITILSNVDFNDQLNFSISGAVREPGEHFYNIRETLKVSEAINLSKGLLPEAYELAYLFRYDPENPKRKDVLELPIQQIVNNPDRIENIVIRPNDELVVFSKLDFTDELTVTVSGAVRKSETTIPYGPSLTLKNALILAGGLNREASKSNIDIFRLEFNGDQSSRTIAATLKVNESYDPEDGTIGFDLQPFDHIVVRSIPDFEFQQMVNISGEVNFPGEYALTSENETILSVLKRAGGFSQEAFPDGASLVRTEDEIGSIIMHLPEVLRNPNSRFNYILKGGDQIVIPKKIDFVTIFGSTRADELYPENLAQKTNTPFFENRNAKFYVEKYAGGVGKQGRPRLISVEHPNGEVQQTKKFLFLNIYPEVRPGSVIKVGAKPVKEEKLQPTGEKEQVDWGQTIGNTVAQVTGILSLILLVQQINK
jgi:protein involved in polysaccharide export with SLBB domain